MLHKGARELQAVARGTGEDVYRRGQLGGNSDVTRLDLAPSVARGRTEPLRINYAADRQNPPNIVCDQRVNEAETPKLTVMFSVPDKAWRPVSSRSKTGVTSLQNRICPEAERGHTRPLGS